MLLTVIRIAPKKKEQQKMSLGAFLTDESKNDHPGTSKNRTLMLCRNGFMG